MQRNLWEQFKDAFRKGNNGLIQLILINGIVFLVIRLSEVILSLTGLLPSAQPGYYEVFYVYEYLGLPASLGRLLFRPWTVITTFFTHYDFFHILFNMLFLYWFGTLIKEYLGNRKLINLYVLGGLVGGLFYIVIYNISPFFSPQTVASSGLVGASAGVLAIVVGAATLMPNHQFHLILIGPVKIKYIAIFYVGAALLGSINPANAGGDLAHLGGCLVGYLYVTQLQKGNDIGLWVGSTLEFLKTFFMRPKIKVSHRKTTRNKPKPSASKQAPGTRGVPQEEIDAILDKINAKGYESLTKEEKQKLFNASSK